MGTNFPYGVTAEDLRRLERRRANLDRTLSLKKQMRARELARLDDMIASIETDLADTIEELREKTEEWENQRSGQ